MFAVLLIADEMMQLRLEVVQFIKSSLVDEVLVNWHAEIIRKYCRQYGANEDGILQSSRLQRKMLTAADKYLMMSGVLATVSSAHSSDLQV